jgi:DDE superfamily endonuclease
VLATAKFEADCVMRIRSNTCLWGIPPAYSGRGRPRKHGEKFQLTNSENWISPDSALELDTSSHGRIRVKMWKDLHFSQAADHPVNLIMVGVDG